MEHLKVELHENMDVNEYKKKKHEFSEVICCDLITPV